MENYFENLFRKLRELNKLRLMKGNYNNYLALEYFDHNMLDIAIRHYIRMYHPIGNIMKECIFSDRYEYMKNSIPSEYYINSRNSNDRKIYYPVRPFNYVYMYYSLRSRILDKIKNQYEDIGNFQCHRSYILSIYNNIKYPEYFWSYYNKRLDRHLYFRNYFDYAKKLKLHLKYRRKYSNFRKNHIEV